MHFHVANPTLPWHQLFRVMEEVIAEEDHFLFSILVVSVLIIIIMIRPYCFIRMLDQAKAEVGEGLEYSVSQTTLEQVVLFL